MKYLFIICLLFTGSINVSAQQLTAAQMQQKGKTFMQKGDFENAIRSLTDASKLEPRNLELLKDLSFACYLQRNFAKAIETGNAMLENAEVDPQAYQILGLSYKAIASYKECEKLYKEGLKKFPKSGVLHNAYGELLVIQDNPEDAIVEWEAGIELDPGYSSNYYNAAIYYVHNENWIRAALYGELFLNLESYSTRSEEVKPKLREVYSRLTIPGEKNRLIKSKTITPFEKTVLELLNIPTNGGSLSVDQLVSIRTRFLVDWLQGHQNKFPFRLFDQQQYLLNQGLFEAYNYWLFNPTDYKTWKDKHPKETDGYKTFQQSRVFKIPAGEYYFSLKNG